MLTPGPPGSKKTKNFQPSLALVAGAASLATVAVLIVLKLTATLYSGSASVMASLIDSVMDAGVSLISLLAIRISLSPADEDHRFGHGKVEGLAALFQSAFIAGGGVFLTLETFSRFNEQRMPDHDMLAIAVMVVSIGLSLILVGIQRITLRSAPSLAVEADSTHYAMDILVNIGVIIVLLLLAAGLPLWIDPLFALAVAVYLFRTGYVVAIKSIDMLIDREAPNVVRQAITKQVLAHPDVLGMHDLRTRISGMKMFVSFDIELEPALSLEAAHDIVRRVEHALFEQYPQAEILIHPDPHGDIHDTRHQVRGVHDKPLA